MVKSGSAMNQNHSVNQAAVCSFSGVSMNRANILDAIIMASFFILLSALDLGLLSILSLYILLLGLGLGKVRLKDEYCAAA